MTIRELREKRAGLATQARSIIAAAQNENRAYTEDEKTKLSRLWDELEVAKGEIEIEERQSAIEAELDLPARDRKSGREDRGLNGGPSADPAENEALERRAFADWMRNGQQGMSDESRRILAERGRRLTESDRAELRALTTTTTGGGYTVPTQTRAEIVSGMKRFGGMRKPGAAEILTTDGGAPIDYPTNDDTGNTGALLAENAASTDQDTTFGSTELNAYIYTSKIIRVPVTLIQDSGVDIEAYVRRILSERMGRITESHYATGDGSSKPRGITVGAANSALTIDISDGVITIAALIGILHSVDPEHRENGAWMFHDNILKLIKNLSFSSAMPWGIWQPSLRDGEPDLILGKPYIVNNSMPDASTATNRPLVFGDLSAYKIRDVRDIIMLRLVERYGEYFQVGFVGFMRTDGDLIDPGSNPVKYAAMVA